MTQQVHQSFAEFWPFYVQQHANPSNRWLHVCGTLMGLGMVALAALTQPLPWILLAPACGYGFAWVGHFFVERNIPATFTYPLWSLRGDFKMLTMMLTGQMEAEVDRLRQGTGHGSQPG